MGIHLSPEAKSLIQDKVASGRYATADEVIQAAIRLLDDHDRLVHLQSLLAVGLAQADRGEAVELTPQLLDNIAQEVEERFQRGDESNPDVGP